MSERGIGPQVIIDTHQHFWMRDDQTFLPDDLRAAVATTDVVATVYIECDSWYRPDGPEPLRSVGETEWVVANAPDFVAGIVGKADLRLGAAVAEVLDAHAAAGGDLFKGIRQTTLYEPTPDSWQMEPSPGPGLLSDASFREGFTVLDRFGLRFEALVWFHQLPEVVDLARAFPDTTIVLNHLGGPSGIRPWRDRRPEMLSSWRHHLAAAAECPNIVAKVGAAFGMNILAWGREGSRERAEADGFKMAASREAFFETSDVVSIHIPLLPDARGIITAGDLGRMKPSALFVNTSRAGLVEEGALEAALKAGRPGSAAVDVYEDEPVLNGNHPLLKLDNCLCSPHLGYVSNESMEQYVGGAFDRVVAFAEGNPIDVINPEVLK